MAERTKSIISQEDLYEIAKNSYYAYGRETDWKTFSGENMIEFCNLPENIKKAWMASANHTIRETLDRITHSKKEESFKELVRVLAYEVYNRYMVLESQGKEGLTDEEGKI